MTQRYGPREGLLLPILIPVGALALIAAALYGFSRVLLKVSPAAATATALVAAAGIMVVAAYVASRKDVGGSALLSMVGGVLGVTMVAGGAALLLGAPHEEAGETRVVALAAPVNAATDGFSTDAVSAPAGEPFVISFTSEDPVVHNVELAPAEGEASFFSGSDVLGPGGSADYPIDPLEVGEYYFFCKYHALTMTGTLTVKEAPAGGGEGPTVVAAGIAFDTDTIELAADTESSITFENRDAGTTHNIAIYTDETATEVIWDGADVPGPASVPYTVPPIAAGEYFFRCDTHPPMAGAVVVGGVAGEEPGGG